MASSFPTNFRGYGSGTWISSAYSSRRCTSTCLIPAGEGRSPDPGNPNDRSTVQLLDVFARLNLLRGVLRGLSVNGDAHRDTGPDDLKDAGFQGFGEHGIRLHVRDLDRLIQG